MNVEELVEWITVTNVTLARAQRPNATYLACPFVWGCFDRVVDFDSKPIVLLEMRVKVSDRSDFTIRSRNVYDLRDTMGGDDFPNAEGVMEIAKASALYIDYIGDGLTIFQSV